MKQEGLQSQNKMPTANGEPIMCAIIFTAKWQLSLGFDPFTEWIGEDHEIDKNIGEDTVYPMGQMFNRKNITCFCYC
jgi:hypothetical protein